MHGRCQSRRRPRGNGSRGPRTSAVRHHAAEGLAAGGQRCGSDCALLLFLIAVAGCMVIGAALLGACLVCTAALGQPYAKLFAVLPNATGWSGFEFDSTLGYPGEGPPTPIVEEELRCDEELYTPEVDTWLEELRREEELLLALPVVQKVDFFTGNTSNLTKVEATLNCCWASGQFKRVKEACTDNDQKPTLVEAARALRATIEKDHCCAGHQHHQRAIERREALAASGQGTARNMFDRMKMAAAYQSRVRAQAELCRKHVAEAQAAELASVRAREAAEEALSQAQAAAAALEPAPKKQKAAGGANTADAAVAAEEDATDDEPTWRSWTLARWRKHEAELQRRRGVEVLDLEMGNTDESLPARGDEQRGWRLHWRRGLVGALKDWAEGSRYRIVHMLAALAKHFGVEEEVSRADILRGGGVMLCPTLPRPCCGLHAAGR
jgi:hypothetical protein